MNSQSIFKQGSKTFSLASRFFPKQIREDVALFYSWCRWCDDIADGSILGFDQNPKGLPKNRIDLLFQKGLRAASGDCEDLEPPWIAFGKIMQKYQIPWVYAEDLLNGMQHDVQETQIETIDDLFLYCYRVAGTVGLMMCHIMGLKNSRALKYAVHLGMALQITNILRDIGDDFRVSKIYLPQSWLSKVNIPKNDLFNFKYEWSLKTLAFELVHEADYFYQSGLLGLKDLPWRCALAVAIASSLYQKIGYRALKSKPFGCARTQLNSADKVCGILIGFIRFARTIPSRVFSSHTVMPIDQIWRYL